MELIYHLSPCVNTNLGFYFKLSFVLFLFIFNIYLILTHKKEEHSNRKELPILQAGFNFNKLKGFLGKFAALGGLLSTAITLKNELKSVQLGRLDELMEAEREGIRKSIEQDREGYQKILNSIENSREELLKLHLEKAKILGHNERLLTLQSSIKDKVLSYQEKSSDPSTKLSDLGILDQLIKQDTSKFIQELDSLTLVIDPSSLTENEVDITEDLKDLKESSVFNFNFDILSSIDWFEGLNGLKKLAVSLIIGKSVIFSALTSIIFIFYGNILIEKYDLEKRYPKLAKLIQLRRKFQKYYFNYSCFLIISIIIYEIAFALAVLFWL